ncbi:MAG: carboxylesterase/lipase family protein [Spirochaetes bacterium]|uniref:Carboxylesterase/lipase family protein n=1 Tax=Candidatus Ornithospirochaeta stercoripullorum TaxID=2840899 RepID=A0A9D9H4P8_9SPIO|nr:carboxylesterase/lipase family protein [Candidatus Ornithospirochaeta stercoripullorum]
MKRLLTFLVLLAAIAAFAFGADGPVVNTEYGPVQGIHPDTSLPDVVEYRGIPFAAPPVGDLRWKAPQDPEPWTEVLVCDTYAPIPMQVLGGATAQPYDQDFYFDGVPEMSEDCLYLNVVTTETNIAEGGKPVFVWFHGGGLNSCYTFEPEANGAEMAERGIVVVSVEQRLGPFGYLALPQLTEEQGQSGNYGLMDQIKAMEWVRDNIAQFGGDPDNITAGGQSGGTTKSMAMLMSPEMDVKVNRLILESGLKYRQSYPTNADAEAQGERYLEDLGLDPAITLDELRAIPADGLIDNTSANYPQAMNQDGLYVVYPDNYDAIMVGVFDNVQILSGTNLGEGSYPASATADAFYAGFRAELGDELYDAYDFENLVKVTDVSAQTTARQLGTYGLGSNVSRNLMVNRLYGAMIAERTNGETKNYTYLFSHFTPESVSDIGTARSAAEQWAWHSSEMWYTFDSLKPGLPAVREWTDYDYQLADIMCDAWVSFIKTGDPNNATLPVEWPVADDGMGYIQFGNGISAHTGELTKLEQLMADYTTQEFGPAN